MTGPAAALRPGSLRRDPVEAALQRPVRAARRAAPAALAGVRLSGRGQAERRQRQQGRASGHLRARPRPGARGPRAPTAPQAVVEEYVAGPSLSIEVVALGGEVVTLLPTWLEFDAAYDCKRVVAPVGGAIGVDGVVATGRRAERGSDGRRAPVPEAVSDATLAALDDAARRLAEGVALARRDGRRGDGLGRRHAQGDRDRRPAAEPDAGRRVPRKRRQHRRAARRDLRRRAAAGGRRPRPGAAPYTSTCWSRAAGSRCWASTSSARPVRCGVATASTAPTWCSPTGSSRARSQRRWVAVLMTRGATAAAARERAAAAVARLADEHGLELVPESSPELVGVPRPGAS